MAEPFRLPEPSGLDPSKAEELRLRAAKTPEEIGREAAVELCERLSRVISSEESYFRAYFVLENQVHIATERALLENLRAEPRNGWSTELETAPRPVWKRGDIQLVRTYHCDENGMPYDVTYETERIQPANRYRPLGSAAL